MAGELLEVEVIRVAHGDAEGFGLLAAGDDAAVLVEEEDDRPAVEARAEGMLAADIVGEGGRISASPIGSPGGGDRDVMSLPAH